VSTRRPPSLRDRHVIVIGGASEIGRGIAEAALARPTTTPWRFPVFNGGSRR
jgi:hypothetical protein